MDSKGLGAATVRRCDGATARYTAAGRAIETKRPDTERLIADPFAAVFAGDQGFAFLKEVAKSVVPPTGTASDLEVTPRRP